MEPSLSDAPRSRRWLRRLLWIGGGTVGVLLAGGAGLVGCVYVNASISTVGTLTFDNPLRIPELVEGTADDDGVVRFDLALQHGTSEFFDGVETTTWGANGAYLGPTLRASRGDQVEVSVYNGLGEITTMHWHGMHLPAVMDGGPHQPIHLNETWRPAWTIDQPAATLWYHPHPHGATAQHVYRGVAGMFLLDDAAAAALELPDRYGIDDIPLIVQDRSFDGDGQFDGSSGILSGLDVLGDTILVNGTHDPHVDIADELVRFRVLNASNSRFFTFAFDDERAFDLIGTDGGLLPAPASLHELPLSPGERAEIVVRFAPGERAVLRSVPAPFGSGSFSDRFNGAHDEFDIIEIRAAGRLAGSPPIPTTLASVEPVGVRDAVAHRTFELSNRRINGQAMDMARIDAEVAAGSVEIWSVANRSGTPHNFHIHDMQFQVLDVDGRPPPAHLRGWHDTVPTPPGSVTRLAIPFGTYADPTTPYMFHCHVLSHEDRGMMGQFVVI